MIKDGHLPAIKKKPEELALSMLAQLSFDPLAKLIAVSKKLDEEISISERQRSGSVVKLGLSGRTQKYSSMQHVKLLELQTKLLQGLMDYSYYKLPILKCEQENDAEAIPAFEIQLTQEGEEFIMVDNEEGN